MRLKNLVQVGLIISLLIFSFLVKPEQDQSLYFSNPDTLPEWVEQGNFRFIRLDGGGIEAKKAERTWWGMNFTDEEKDILAHIYDRDFEKILALLKDAEFNWVWVTWSNGWAWEDEAENRQNLEKVINRCHQEGIKVTAYLSSANMFWWSVFRREPETKRYLLKEMGLPVFYGGSPHRVLADTRIPEWRAYLLKKAESALEAGADAIFYDNIFGDNYANKLLLSETQRLAEKKAQESGRTKALVYANVHIGPERFDLNDHCDLLWDESGKSTPGVFETGWQIANIRKIKFLSGAKQLWQPLKYENDRYHCGPRESCIPPPAEQKLAIAEAYAFGAGLSRNIEGRFLKGLIKEEKVAREAWSAIAQYNKFIKENNQLYHQVIPIASIALLSKTENNPFADALIKKNIMFQTKVLSRMDQGIPLNNFKILVIPFKLEKLTPAQEKIIRDFVQQGGKIFSAPSSSEFFKEISPSVKWIPRKIIFLADAGEKIDRWLEELNQEAGGPLLSLENDRYLIAHLTKKQFQNIFILHLLNYDLKNFKQNIKVKINFKEYLGEKENLDLKIISPDGMDQVNQKLKCPQSLCEFTIKQIKHYTLAIISSE